MTSNNKILVSPIGSAVSSALTERGFSDTDLLEISEDVCERLSSLANYVSHLTREDMVLVPDRKGGAFVPYPDMHSFAQRIMNDKVKEEPKKLRLYLDFKELAHRIFRGVWGIEPKESDANLIQQVLEEYFKENSQISE